MLSNVIIFTKITFKFNELAFLNFDSKIYNQEFSFSDLKYYKS